MLLTVGYFFIVYYWLMSFEWMNRAACKGLTHKMFPVKFNDKTYIIEAKKICASCPVSKPCLEYALEFTATEMHGVWAGLTHNQLAREQRKRGMTEFRPTTLSILNQAASGKKRGPKPRNTRGS
jgi:WhiB family redox-sensing transcriptional regulator